MFSPLLWSRSYGPHPLEAAVGVMSLRYRDAGGAKTTCLGAETSLVSPLRSEPTVTSVAVAVIQASVRVKPAAVKLMFALPDALVVTVTAPRRWPSICGMNSVSHVA